MWLTLGRKKVFKKIFVPFYWFDQNQLFKQIQIFFRICLFLNMLRKINLLSISVLLSEIINFLTKKRSSLWISPKCFKTTEKHSLAICGSLWGEKLFLLIFVPFHWFIKNNCLNKSKFLSGFTLFKHVKKKKILSS